MKALDGTAWELIFQVVFYHCLDAPSSQTLDWSFLRIDFLGCHPPLFGSTLPLGINVGKDHCWDVSIPLRRCHLRCISPLNSSYLNAGLELFEN
nr:hypothetical protein Iba_scaffold65168CG0010 [Ipomoea batatas]GMD67303.1 hypothetical protein Iba_scaffold49786CG0010 [Ipomoea batatas]